MRTCILPALLLLTGHASAQMYSPSIPRPVHNWGCEVLLCLANPAGPTAVAECVPPIRRLWRHLARGRAFPKCAMATGPNGRSYARPTFSHYDPCPAGLTALPIGQLAELASTVNPVAPTTTRSGMPTGFTAGAPGVTYYGIGSGDGHTFSAEDGPPPTKVCVAGERGWREVPTPEGSHFVGAYDAIYVSPAHDSPRAIDVYIDDALWHRVRW